MLRINPNKTYLRSEIMEVLKIEDRLTFRRLVERGLITAHKQRSAVTGKPWRWYCFGYELLDAYRKMFIRDYPNIDKE